MIYRVKFVDLKEQTINEFEYQNLFDAISVAKKTNIGPAGLHRVAIPDAVFNVKFTTLMKRGYIYVGLTSLQHPKGDFMIQLLRVSNRGEEQPVFSPVDEVTNFGFVNQLIHKTEPGAGNYS